MKSGPSQFNGMKQSSSIQAAPQVNRFMMAAPKAKTRAPMPIMSANKNQSKMTWPDFLINDTDAIDIKANYFDDQVNPKTPRSS